MAISDTGFGQLADAVAETGLHGTTVPVVSFIKWVRYLPATISKGRTSACRYWTLESSRSGFADELRGRLARLFLRGADGQRPFLGRQVLSRAEPFFDDHILFNEFFHGETGAGLGASHQTGWTGLIALLLHPRDSKNPWLLDIASLRTAAQPSTR